MTSIRPSLSARSAPVEAMGLHFPNPIGLAAGIDRTGEHAPSLLGSGFGHVEIGTINSETGLAAPLRNSTNGARLGINIGSLRLGLDDLVIADFEIRLRQAAPFADYVAANLTAPAMQRSGNSPGVDQLVRRLSEVRDEISEARGRQTPLLVKLDGGAIGDPIPAAVTAVRVYGLDGIVLVSDRLRRIEEISNHMAALTLISVGGIQTSADICARLTAGASLVQIHRAFADGGKQLLLRMLAEL